MTIDEIRDKKTELEKNITQMIQEFKKETGVSVSEIELHSNLAFEYVTLEIKI